MRSIIIRRVVEAIVWAGFVGFVGLALYFCTLVCSKPGNPAGWREQYERLRSGPTPEEIILMNGFTLESIENPDNE